MKAQKQMRSDVQVGSFVSMPEAFPGADDAVKYAPKLEFRVRRSDVGENPPRVVPVLQPYRLLVDLEAVDASRFDARKLARDCELVKAAALSDPEKLRSILAAFAEGKSEEEIRRAARAVVDLGLDEEQVVKAGGGLIWLVVFAAAAVLSCSCPKVPTHPGTNPPGK